MINQLVDRDCEQNLLHTSLPMNEASCPPPQLHNTQAQRLGEQGYFLGRRCLLSILSQQDDGDINSDVDYLCYYTQHRDCI